MNNNKGFFIHLGILAALIWGIVLAVVSCNNPVVNRKLITQTKTIGLNLETPELIPTKFPKTSIGLPTPDIPHPLPSIRLDTVQYSVQNGDTLKNIALRFGISLDQLVKTNQITDPDRISVGQILIIPPPFPVAIAPDYKIIPDSELVDGPAVITLNLYDLGLFFHGYLFSYSESIGDELLTGLQIIERVSREQSVNPRLLLALLEYQSQWITKSQPEDATFEYPIGLMEPSRKGLYHQLSWAANNLNRGYYLWRVNAISHWILKDNNIIAAQPSINTGTAGVQYLMSLLYDYSAWEKSVTQNGIQEVYRNLFGNPFDIAVEPIVPDDLVQPPLQLPFASNEIWSFTSGPHGGWGDGSGWAALDFAPPGEALGCVESDAWVVAMAPGVVTRSDNGVVILDLDGDGFEQTGWILIYMHIETSDRVKMGARLEGGENIGHPSCEGGVSTGTHVHIARRYNGEWIPADGPIPFNLDGWISEGSGSAYNGFLRRNGEVVKALSGRYPENRISR